MVTQTPNHLSHEEALELLPWHINSTLDESLSELVADHVEQCRYCQEESAILSNTIVALNSSDEVSTNLEGRFSKLLNRVRSYEQAQQAPQQSVSVAQRVADWLGLRQPRLQSVGVFALGLIVGVTALLVTLQQYEVDPGAPSEYVSHGTDPEPLRLRVLLDAMPDAKVLSELQRASGIGADWQQQSDTEFLVELSETTTVKSVAQIRTRLLAHDAVTGVTVDIGATDSD